MSKRRKGFPSERQVKRGVRIVGGNKQLEIVGGDKQLEEKLGRNDLCPCGSGKRFKRCCLISGSFLMGSIATTTFRALPTNLWVKRDRV